MSDNELPYKLQEISGKGEGLVATRKLLPGSIIVTEKPLIAVDTEGAFKNVFSVYQSLPEDKKKVVMSLFDPGEELNFKPSLFTENKEERKVLRIFEANSIDLCSHQEMNINKSGLYQTISKINHSCSPNVVWTWLKEDKTKYSKQVRVCREIKLGEEIVASYCASNDIFPTRQKRRELLNKWFFTCRCQVCELSGEDLKRNEDSRKEIQNLHDLIPVQSSTGNVAQALESANKKLKVLKSIRKEMLIEIPSALMECCELAAHLRIPTDKTEAMKKKAEEMSAQLGDVHMYNFNKKSKKIAKIR